MVRYPPDKYNIDDYVPAEVGDMVVVLSPYDGDAVYDWGVLLSRSQRSPDRPDRPMWEVASPHPSGQPRVYIWDAPYWLVVKAAEDGDSGR